MIIDVTGVELIPGNDGNDCPGNGEHTDENGYFIECCCDECDYMQCCDPSHSPFECWLCLDWNCPHTRLFFWKRNRKKI